MLADALSNIRKSFSKKMFEVRVAFDNFRKNFFDVLADKKKNIRKFFAGNFFKYCVVMYLYGLTIHLVAVFLFDDFSMAHFILRPLGYAIGWHLIKYEFPLVVKNYRL